MSKVRPGESAATPYIDNAMYPQFFGFDKLPFRVRPDPDFLYSGPEYLRARAGVLAALRGNSRVVLFSGPPGVGKTLLLEDVLAEIAGQFALCRINQPHISATELLQALVMQLGSPSGTDANRARLFTELAASLNAAGTRDAPPLLVIDDAQLLAGATLLTFGDILAAARRLKILLVARSDQQPRNDGLAARVGVVEKPREVHLGALSADGAKAYIEHRLAVAGGSGKEVFTADAYAMIFQHTGGAARLINVLCDAALHAACLRASGHVSAAEILLATQDARWPDAVARDKAGPGAPTPNAPTLGPAAASAQLLVNHRRQHIATCALEPGRISIGRALDNELRIDAPFISRHHCQVVTVGNVSTIEDLGSVNGISVNGKLVKQHVLQHADQIMLGEHVLTYVVS
jgi:general secretion pathway protein A